MIEREQRGLELKSGAEKIREERKGERGKGEGNEKGGCEGVRESTITMMPGESERIRGDAFGRRERRRETRKRDQENP